MQRPLLVLAGLLLTGLSLFASSEDEVSLFDSKRKPVAYVAEDLTIYLWSGKPVAYLQKDSSGGVHVYGFNGKHLGWFVKGIVRDHKGKVAGGIKEVFSAPTEFESFKSFKQFKPFKSFREFAPFRPFIANTWSDTSLKLFLLTGVIDEDEMGP